MDRTSAFFFVVDLAIHSTEDGALEDLAIHSMEDGDSEDILITVDGIVTHIFIKLNKFFLKKKMKTSSFFMFEVISQTV